MYHLHNKTGFNVTVESLVRTTLTGKEIALTAIHSNRSVKLCTDYDVLDHQFKQHSKLELGPTVWIAYDLDIQNKTRVTVICDYEQQQITLNVGRMRIRNLSRSKSTWRILLGILQLWARTTLRTPRLRLT